MKISHSIRFFILAALLTAPGLACGRSQSLPQPTAPVTPTQTAADALPTIAPTLTASPTVPPLPSPTPVEILPTDIPASTGPILSPENAAALTILETWGLGSPQGLKWSASGSQIAVGFQAGILVFDADSGRQSLRLPGAGWLTGMDISPDGQTLAVLHANQTIEFYDLSNGERISSLPEITPNRPVSLQYTPAGTALLVGLHEGLISLVDFHAQDVAIGIFGDLGYPVETLTLLPDPLRVVGMSNDLGLSVWQMEDPQNPQFLYNLAGTADTVSFLSVTASPNGRWLAASTWDGLLFLWDMREQDPSVQFQTLWPLVEGFDLPGAWNALAFSADSRTLASGADNGELWLWDLEDAQPWLSAQPGQSALKLLAYSPDGKTLAAVYSDGQSVLFDSSSLELKHSLPTGSAWGGSLAAASHDGRFIATATQAYLGDGSMLQIMDGAGLYLRSYADGSIIRHMDTGGFAVSPSGFTSLALSPDGRWLAASPLGLPLAVWDTRIGEMVYILDDFDPAAYTCSRVLYAPDGLWLATACAVSQVTLWQASTGAYQRSFQTGLADPITALDFAPNGAWLAGAGGSGPVYLWSLAEDDAVRTLELFDPAPITNLSFSPDGRYLACTTSRNMPQVVVWDTASDEQVTALGFNDTVTAAVFSPDARLLAIAVNFEFFDVLEIWDWQAQEVLHSERYDTELTQVFFSPDGRLVTTVSQDGLLRVWGLAP